MPEVWQAARRRWHTGCRGASPTYLAGYALGGAPRFLVLITGAPLRAVLATSAVSGLGLGFINPIIGAVIYEQIPRPLLGRVIALTDSAAWAGSRSAGWPQRPAPGRWQSGAICDQPVIPGLTGDFPVITGNRVAIITYLP